MRLILEEEASLGQSTDDSDSADESDGADDSRSLWVFFLNSGLFQNWGKEDKNKK